MAEKANYQMAIDLLSCHLGLSEEEAKEHLGINDKKEEEAKVVIPGIYLKK
ncbi:hypothetical protein HC725_00260 [Vibrio sp. S17_S38]|uniref:hypothetical protein n=1 Tax=Vibrio sp. S17_S38 TaxID=2720229 RepID=UPI0016818161|nr:hypothetical protein [Vibrio sp. S17_S38]MBD1571710.1 hypothetical protein [Vibrio sp. S17_S38]